MKVIEINGTMYPIKYGHSVLKKFMDKYKLTKFHEVAKLPEMLAMKDMPEFLKAGFDCAAKIESGKSPFTLAEVENLLEEHYWLVQDALEALNKSIERPNAKPEPQPERVTDNVEEGN